MSEDGYHVQHNGHANFLHGACRDRGVGVEGGVVLNSTEAYKTIQVIFHA